MKKIFGILFIFSFVCGYPQVFDFPHRIYSLETKFLKILYTEESSESALLLFQKGDGIYEKCAALTGRKKNTKIPVILTSDEKILNGYYTPYPGTRIVINDTIPGSGELLVFNDTLLGVFTHELTHALGAENRDSFFGFLSAVFGDYVIPSYGFNLPLFLVEGLAVYGETSVLSGFYGFPQGRLNDSSYGEKLVLAKSLGDFPSWQEVSGAGNEYYDGSLPYIYGAGFVEYLAENYGENKITTLLENSSSFNFLFTDGVFKKTFGLSIDVLWENFRNSITAVEFCKNSFIQDSGTGLSGKGLDFAVTAADCYYEEKEGVGRVAVYDSVSGRVFSYVFSGENSFTEEQPCVYGIEKLKPVFSFRASSVKLSFSHDGKYLAVSGCLSSGNGYKWVTKFFSFEDFRFLNLEIPDSLEAAFIPENNREPEGEYKLVCLSSRTEDYPTLNFFDVRLAGRNSCFSKTSSLFLENTDGVKIQPANITPVINKGILFIGHIGSHRKLFALKGDSLFEVLTGYETETSGGKILPLSITNSVLPNGERILCLGFETGNGVPVWGFLNPGGNTAGLSFDYFPGGINFPLMAGTDFFYTSISDKRRIFSFAKISEKDTGSLQEYKIFTGQEILLPGEIESRNFRFPIPGSEKYSSFSGFYPAFVLPGLNLGPFSSANPWYSVITPGIHYHAGHPGEYWNLSFFGGYNPYYNFPVFNLDFWFGWNDFPLEIILDHKIKGISGNEGRKELSVSWNLPYSFSVFGPKGSTGSVNLQFFNNYTFLTDEFLLEKSPLYSYGSLEKTGSTDEVFLLPFDYGIYVFGARTGFDRRIRTGTGKYDTRGFNAEFAVDFKLQNRFDSGTLDFVNSQELMVSYKHPGVLKFLPVNRDPGGVNMSFPFALSLFAGYTTGLFFPVDSESYFYHCYGDNILTDKAAYDYYGNFILGTRLFSSLLNININKALGLLYFHDIDFTASYKGVWYSGFKGLGRGYFHYLDLTVTGGFTPVIGALTSVELDFDFTARFVPETFKWYFSFFYMYNF